MPKLDRYLISEFVQATFATSLVLLVVSFGGVFTRVLKDIASGRVPVGMLLPQLGLSLLEWLALVLPLALMIGLMLSVGRMYRDSEMPVIASIGVGPRRLLRPVLWMTLPVVALVAMCSLWLGPWADSVSKQMVNEASRNLLVAGLEPGRFTSIGNGGVVFIGNMSGDGSQFSRIFIYRQSDTRQDVTTAKHGELSIGDDGQRYLTLKDGFEVEGPRDGGLDFRLMRYARNEALMPMGDKKYDPNDPELLSTFALLGDERREATAQLHRRLAPPLLTLAFALLAIPMARSTPRQARYGRVMMAFLTYLVGTQLMLLGTRWLESGKIAIELGLWWLVIPLLLVAAVLYFTDGRLGRPRVPRLAGAKA